MLLELQKSKKQLPGLFVFFQPRENISGDFFIVERMENAQGEELVIMAVADCTGNGVPAGMLSFLCNSLLKEAFLSKEVQTPADALEYVRNRILSLFKFDRTEYVYDAMVISGGGYPGYWWGYPGGWYGAGYWWGYPGYGYYYPWYPITYVTEYEVGTLLIELIDQKNFNPDVSDQFTVRWNAAVRGVVGITDNADIRNRLRIDINQAFEQSPYLKSDL